MSTVRAITMPKWGIEMQEGTVTTWYVTEGDAIAKDAPLVDVETEKIVNTVESPYAGTVRRLLAGPGDVVAVGALIAVYGDAGVSDTEIDAFIRDFRPVDASFEPAADAPAAVAPVATAATPAAAEATGELAVSPIARRLAEKLGVDLRQIKGTGPNGRISKDDVEAYAAAHATAAPVASPAPTAANRSTRTPLSGMRRTIARRLLESKQGIPHYRLERTLEVDALVARRAALKAAGISVSVNNLLVRAVGLALARHPALNSLFANDEVESFVDADVCIAVATEQGLQTPVVRAVNRLTVAEVASRSLDLAARARDGSLTREDISGGTFTVSNLGMHGLDRFDAIINPPQVAILAVGAIREAPVVRGGQVVPGHLMTVTLSCDHRVIDGATGAEFLATLAALVATPDLL